MFLVTFKVKVNAFSCKCISSLTVEHNNFTGPRSAVGNVSGYRCVSDCRSRDREFDPGPVLYFRGD